MKLGLRILIIISACFMLAACMPAPPTQPNNICQIFREYPHWYWDAKKSQQRWGVPISVQMAIIYQESSFNSGARPPRGKLLWIIPWKRPTTAYGYSQALNETWKNYQEQTGDYSRRRNNFEDASDFVGWYSNLAHRKAGIPLNDADDLYLAYHDGINGYLHGSYKSKTWLINTAKRVQTRANTYQRQLPICENNIKKPWWKL